MCDKEMLCCGTKRVKVRPSCLVLSRILYYVYGDNPFTWKSNTSDQLAKIYLCMGKETIKGDCLLLAEVKRRAYVPQRMKPLPTPVYTPK